MIVLPIGLEQDAAGLLGGEGTACDWASPLLPACRAIVHPDAEAVLEAAAMIPLIITTRRPKRDGMFVLTRALPWSRSGPNPAWTGRALAGPAIGGRAGGRRGGSARGRDAGERRQREVR